MAIPRKAYNSPRLCPSASTDQGWARSGPLEPIPVKISLPTATDRDLNLHVYDLVEVESALKG